LRFEGYEVRAMLAHVFASFDADSYLEDSTPVCTFEVAGGPAAKPFFIRYTISGGPDGPSYPTLHFSKGATHAQVPIPITDDTIPGNGYTLKVEITDSSTEDGPFDSAETEIIDNDAIGESLEGGAVAMAGPGGGGGGPGGPGIPLVSISAAMHILEGQTLPNAFSFARSTTTGSLTVQFTIDGLTTASTSDYSSPIIASGMVTFPSGQGSVNVGLTAIDDTLLENMETLVLRILPSPAYTSGGPSSKATLPIHDGEHGIIETS
jgi:hypothetical protein